MMYKCVSDHTEDLTGGGHIAPGAYGEVDETDPHNKARIDDGALIEVPGDVQVPVVDDTEPEPAVAFTGPSVPSEDEQEQTKEPEQEVRSKNKQVAAKSPDAGEAATTADKGKES